MEQQEISLNGQNTRKNFLVSYAHQDFHWAEWIAWHLENEGYTTIVPDWDFRPGMNSVYQLHEATKRAERILVLLSNQYLSTLYAQPEWAVAFQQHIQKDEQVFFPVCLEKCELEGLIGSIIPLELVGLGDERALQKLLEAVKGTRKKPLQVPRYPGKNTLLAGNFPDRNPAFVGREHVLKMVHSALQKGAVTAITHALIASTAGSIGKTQVAAEYVYRHKFNYDTVLWIQDAARPDAVANSLKDISEKLALPIIEENRLEEQLLMLKDWLQQQRDWLLVIDNISDTELLDALLPSLRNGQVLLTTRERSFATYAHLIELEERTPEEKECAEKLAQLVKVALYSEDSRPIPLKPGQTTLGRHTDNDFPIDHSTVSAFHAIIEQDEQAYYITDRGSEHGTFINGERLIPGSRHQLCQEEPILLGSYLLAYGSLDKPVFLLPAPTIVAAAPVLADSQPSLPINTKSQDVQTEIQVAQMQSKIMLVPPQLPRLDNPDQIVQQIWQEKQLASWKVQRPRPITANALPLPEPVFTLCIFSCSFCLLSAFFLYLCILSGGGPVAFLSFDTTLGLAAFTVVSCTALAFVRDEQLSKFLKPDRATRALLITTPEGFIQDPGLPDKPMQSVSFADLQFIIVKCDNRLNTAWLELFYRDGHEETWDMQAFFGPPCDICVQLFDAFTYYLRVNSSLLHDENPALPAEIASNPTFLQIVLISTKKHLKILLNWMAIALWSIKKRFIAFANFPLL